MRVGIATQVFVGFSILLMTMLGLAFVSVQEIRGVGRDLRRLRDGHLSLARSVAQLESQQQNRLRDLRRAVQEPDPDSQSVLLRIATSYYPGVLDSIAGDIQQICRRTTFEEEDASASFRYAAGTRAMCEGLSARISALARPSSQVRNLAQRAFQAASADQSLEPLQPELDRLDEPLRAALFELDGFLRSETDAAVARATEQERNAAWRVFISTLGAVVIGLLLTARAARTLRPIRPLVRYARALARGDYHQPLDVNGNGELSILADELRRMAKARDDREDELDRQATELEQAYMRVAELKTHHERVVRSLKTAVVVTDRSLAITTTNRAAEQEWRLEQVLGQSLADLPLGRELNPHVGHLSDVLSSKTTTTLSSVPLQGRLADVVLAPLASEAGETLGLILALEDVTEAVRTKEALLRSERLAAIGRMSAHVTHELRNPLASIALNAELLGELYQERGSKPLAQGEAKEARDLCRAIEREADRLTGLTEEYLKFARLPRPEMSAEEPGPWLRSLAHFVARDCEAAGVEVKVDSGSELPELRFDPDQMRQAVLNLIRNAKEAMPTGGRILLAAHQEETTVVLSVKDNGPGIDAESLRHIFDPFYSTKLTGTGLGLALTQQIVQEHGANLEVHSTVGQGTEFRVRFPSQP